MLLSMPAGLCSMHERHVDSIIYVDTRPLKVRGYISRNDSTPLSPDATNPSRPRVRGHRAPVRRHRSSLQGNLDAGAASSDSRGHGCCCWRRAERGRGPAKEAGRRFQRPAQGVLGKVGGRASAGKRGGVNVFSRFCGRNFFDIARLTADRDRPSL